MKSLELFLAVENAREDAKNALQLLWNSVNKGQKKQIIKKSEIVEMFDRFGVDYSDIE